MEVVSEDAGAAALGVENGDAMAAHLDDVCAPLAVELDAERLVQAVSDDELDAARRGRGGQDRPRQHQDAGRRAGGAAHLGRWALTCAGVTALAPLPKVLRTKVKIEAMSSSESESNWGHLVSRSSPCARATPSPAPGAGP